MCFSDVTKTGRFFFLLTINLLGSSLLWFFFVFDRCSDVRYLWRNFDYITIEKPDKHESSQSWIRLHSFSQWDITCFWLSKNKVLQELLSPSRWRQYTQYFFHNCLGRHKWSMFYTNCKRYLFRSINLITFAGKRLFYITERNLSSVNSVFCYTCLKNAIVILRIEWTKRSDYDEHISYKRWFRFMFVSAKCQIE